jgi:copper chaperone CopZ
MWLRPAFVVLGILTAGASSTLIAGDSGDTVSTTFEVEGMHCDGCSATIVGTLERVDGVVSASAEHEKGVAEVRYRPRDVSAGQLKAAIEKLGYTVTAMETTPVQEKHT